MNCIIGECIHPWPAAYRPPNPLEGRASAVVAREKVICGADAGFTAWAMLGDEGEQKRSETQISLLVKAPQFGSEDTLELHFSDEAVPEPCEDLSPKML